MKILKTSLAAITAVLAIFVTYETYQVVQANAITPEIRSRYLGPEYSHIRLEDIPDNWVNILLTVEDPCFMKHKGIDMKSPGAGYTTLAQAMTKYLYFDKFQPGFAKIEQSLIARFVFDRHFSKEEQLRIFYNSAYLGHHQGAAVRGFHNAARVYHGKEFAELTEKEYVALVAMLVSPKQFILTRNPAANAERVSRINKLLSGEYRPRDVRDIFYDG